MKEFEARSIKLKQILVSLEEQNEQYRLAAQRFAQTAGTGQDDDILYSEAGKFREAYKETKVEAVELIQESHRFLCEEAEEARRRGVEFPKHDAESFFMKSPDEYDHQHLIKSIEFVYEGIASLLAAIKTFETFQFEIQQSIEQLKSTLQQLESLRINTSDDTDILKSFEHQFTNVTNSRNALLQDVSNVLSTWQQRVSNSLQSKINEAYAVLELELQQLQSLDAATDADIAKVQNFKGELYHPGREKLDYYVLNEIESLSGDFRQRSNSARQKLIEIIENLTLEAKHEINRLHPKMPEVVALNNFLEKSPTVEETELSSYWKQLELSVTDIKCANINAIKRFQIKIQDNSEYIFSKQDEVEILGVALVNLAEEPEQYSGSLWWLGAEIMLRLELSEDVDIDGQVFYESHGYPAVASAIKAATQNGTFTPILSVFSSDFLPPNTDGSQDNVTEFLRHPLIQEAFQEAVKANTLRLNPDEFQKFALNKQKALLKLLCHKNELELPTSTRLQWSALLHNAFDVGSEEHDRVTRLLLDALLSSGQYLGLYYSLCGLEAYYPNVWKTVEYRPLLFHIILQAIHTEIFDKEVEGRNFLVDLCLHPGIRELSRGDFASEFLLASLAQHAAVRWDRSELVNEAWATWDKLSTRYSTLCAILQRELQGEHFGVNIVVSADELKQEFDDSINDLALRMSRPGNLHPLGYQIHTWYVDRYMNKWMEQLKIKDLTETDIKDLANEVSELIHTGDLIEATDVNLSARTSTRRARSQARADRFRLQINRRLFELLDSFQQVIKIRRQINSKKSVQVVSREKLQQELVSICAHSDTTKWALVHLLAPGLPFIRVLLSSD